LAEISLEMGSEEKTFWKIKKLKIKNNNRFLIFYDLEAGPPIGGSASKSSLIEFYLIL